MPKWTDKNDTKAHFSVGDSHTRMVRCPDCRWGCAIIYTVERFNADGSPVITQDKSALDEHMCGVTQHWTDNFDDSALARIRLVARGKRTDEDMGELTAKIITDIDEALKLRRDAPF